MAWEASQGFNRKTIKQCTSERMVKRRRKCQNECSKEDISQQQKKGTTATRKEVGKMQHRVPPNVRGDVANWGPLLEEPPLENPPDKLAYAS